MGQHMTCIGQKRVASELGYVSLAKRYGAQNCSGCPLRCLCFKGKGNRTMEVNVKSRLYRDQAKQRLTGERGLYHRSMRPIEPEAVFGQMKHDGGFKRFHYRGRRLVEAEFATLAIAHNIRKMASMAGAQRRRQAAVAPGRRIHPRIVRGRGQTDASYRAAMTPQTLGGME